MSGLQKIEGGQISVRQGFILVSLTIVAGDAFLAPGLATRIAGQDAPFSYGIAVPIAGAIIFLLSVLARRYPGQTIFQIAETTWGRIVGKGIGFVFLLWLLYANALITRTMADLTLTGLLEQTPLPVTIGLVAVTVAVMVVTGPEVIARYAEFAFLVIIVVLLFIWGSALKDLEFHRLLPLMTRGLPPIVRASLPVTAVFGEVVLLGVFLPFIEHPKQVLRVGAVGLLIALVRMLGGISFENAMFGAPETGRMLAPMLDMARSIQVTGLVERVDAVLVGVWLLNGFVKIAVFLYAAVLGLSQLTRLSDYRPLVFPVMGTTAVVAFGLFNSTVDLRTFVERRWGPYALVFELGIPIILALGSYIRGKSSSNAGSRGTGANE